MTKSIAFILKDYSQKKGETMALHVYAALIQEIERNSDYFSYETPVI